MRAATGPAYVCHAHPPHLNGKECGHFNATGGKRGYAMGEPLVYCESCGRTKIASDLREAAKAKA